MRNIPAIDGLRGIAVFAVVAYHAGLPVTAGFVGVDVFFVISGFVITRLLNDELRETGRLDVLSFYARRARRILPALTAVILATLWLSLLLLPDSSGVAKSAAAAGVFVANVFFASQAGDYWAADSNVMPLLHLWSLSVEEQFYLLWPAVLLVAGRGSIPVLATIAVVSLAAAEWLIWVDPSQAFYQMPARAWELSVGGLLALRVVAVPKGSAWAGLALVVVSCFFPFAHFPGLGALVPVAGAALLIAAVQSGERMPLLEWRPVVFVGLISYSFYLWHWPLLALDRAVRIGEAPLAVSLGLCGLAFFLAAASYRYIEQPFRRLGANSRTTVFAAVVSMAALTTLALSFGPGPVVQPPTPTALEVLAAQAANDSPANRLRCHFALRHALDDLAREDCTSEPGEPARVAIWGDSYALAWQPFAWELGRRSRLSATSLSRDSCSPVVGIQRGETVSDRWCAEFNTWAMQQTHGMDTVILAAHWQGIHSEQLPDLRSTVERLSMQVQHVLLFGPTPKLIDTVPRCILANDDCALPRSQFDAEVAGIRQELQALAERLSNVEYVEPTDYLCTEVSCGAFREGIPLYWDAHHVSSSAALAFAKQYLGRARSAEGKEPNR